MGAMRALSDLCNKPQRVKNMGIKEVLIAPQSP